MTIATKTKKTLLSVSLRAWVLALAMLVCLAPGCSDRPPDDGASETLPSGPDEATSEAAAEKTGYSADYLPDADYGGYEFRMVAVLPDAMSSSRAFVDVEEETGDIVDDAIYQRNRLIEGRYNIRFRQIGVPDWNSLLPKFQKSISAASDDFDMCMLIGVFAWDEVLKGTVVTVDRLPYLDVTQPWYVHEVNAQKTIGGKMLLAYSDECLNMLEQTICVMFNKKLVADLGLENMYTLVKENAWTVDKFFEMAKKAAADLDGDGQMTDTDRYGIVSTFDCFYSTVWIGSGIKVIEKDENDLLVYNRSPEKLYGLLDKLYQNIHGGDKIFFEAHIDKAPSFKNADIYDIPVMQFANDQGLFNVHCLSVVEALRGMETDFGILPSPKYDKTQAKYYSNVLDGWPLCVPVTNQDLERTSVIMEALAVESRNLVLPAYLEKALRTKYSRDDESLEMLDIIEQSRTSDFGLNMIVRAPLVNDGIAKKKNDFASAIEKNMGKIDKWLSGYNEAALALK